MTRKELKNKEKKLLKELLKVQEELRSLEHGKEYEKIIHCDRFNNPTDYGQDVFIEIEKEHRRSREKK